MNRITVLIESAAICASAAAAWAGGMTLPVRGVRTVERAGALIAGADDPDSLWLDPAGLAHLAAMVGPSCCSTSRTSFRLSTTPASVSNQQIGLTDPDGRRPAALRISQLRGFGVHLHTFGAAYRVTDRLRIGATVSDVVSKVVARLVVSECPGQTVCAPEDPDFDALVQDTQTDYTAPRRIDRTTI